MQKAQQATADIREKQATLQRDSDRGCCREEADRASYEAQLAQAKATLAQQQAVEQQAELNLSYTTIAAPFDGTVGVRTVHGRAICRSPARS